LSKPYRSASARGESNLPARRRPLVRAVGEEAAARRETPRASGEEAVPVASRGQAGDRAVPWRDLRFILRRNRTGVSTAFAPSTPPPPQSALLAALTTAPTVSAVLSAASMLILCMGKSLPLRLETAYGVCAVRRPVERPGVRRLSPHSGSEGHSNSEPVNSAPHFTHSIKSSLCLRLLLACLGASSHNAFEVSGAARRDVPAPRQLKRPFDADAGAHSVPRGAVRHPHGVGAPSVGAAE